MSVYLYCDKKSEKYSQKSINSVKNIEDTQVLEIKNASVIVDIKTTAYAVFDENNKLVKSSLVYRGKKHQFIPKNKNTDIEYMDVDAVYIGNIYPHFGHFLLEQLNRLYGILKIRSKNIKYVFINNRNMNVQKFVYDFMNVLGVKKSDVIILDKSVKFRKIYVPQQTFNISKGCVSDEMPKGYRAMTKRVKGFDYDKVYMSRTKLEPKMQVLGEEKIQKIFKKNGYKIIYPEKMTISEQISVVKNAKYLAGCAGTALHWSLFMKPGGTVVHLKRNSIDDINVRTQYMLNKAAGLNSVFVWASVEKFPSGHGGNHAPQIIGVNKYLKKFFDDFNFKYNNSDVSCDRDAMDEYLKKYEQYKQEYGDVFKRKVCRLVVKISACFVPGRVNRANYRKWLKRKLNLK